MKFHFNPETRIQDFERRGKSGQILGKQQTPPEKISSPEKKTNEPVDGFLSAGPFKGAEASGDGVQAFLDQGSEKFSIVDVELNSSGKEAAKIIRESVNAAPYKPPAGTTGPLTSGEIDSDIFANETSLLSKEHPQVQDPSSLQALDWNLADQKT